LLVEVNPVAVLKLERLQAADRLAAAGALPCRHALAVLSMPFHNQIPESKPLGPGAGSIADQFTGEHGDMEATTPACGFAWTASGNFVGLAYRFGRGERGKHQRLIRDQQASERSSPLRPADHE
jgi:hypothetical protein